MIPLDKIRPVADQVLVRRDPHDTMTAGGLFIPDTAQDAAGPGSRQRLKRGRGVVLAVGPGALERKERTDAQGATTVTFTGRRIAPDVQPGDRVCFSRLLTLGDLDELGHHDCTLISESAIEGILEQEAP